MERCDICGKPATRRAGYAQRMLCDLCSDRVTVQEAYHDELPDIVSLTGRRKYEEALTLLTGLRNKYRGIEHDGWLRRSTLAHEGLILGKKGEYNEALERYRLAQEDNPDPSEFVVNQLSIARLRERMDDHRGAIVELEAGLEMAKDMAKAIPTAWSTFTFYAELVTRIGSDVSVRYRSLLKEVITRRGLIIDEELLNDPVSLLPAIRVAAARDEEGK